MNLLALVLTGGASRRMGRDKAALIVDGEPLGRRICRSLAEAGFEVLVLGREVPGFAFDPDPHPGSGPLAALAEAVLAVQGKGAVFVTSCDVVRLTGSDALALTEALLQKPEVDALAPSIEGRIQPLCAAYCPGAFASAQGLARAGETRVRAWFDGLRSAMLDEAELAALGLEPSHFRGVNTPEELRELRPRRPEKPRAE